MTSSDTLREALDQIDANPFMTVGEAVRQMRAALALPAEGAGARQHTSPGGVNVPAHVVKHEYCPACMASTSETVAAPAQEWGMIIDPPISLPGEEIPLFLKGIAEMNAGLVRPLADIERDMTAPPALLREGQETAHGWNIAQILVYTWQCMKDDQTEQEYPYERFANSEMGLRLRKEITAFASQAVKQARVEEARLWIASEDEREGGLNEHQLCPEEANCLYCGKKRIRIAQLEADLREKVLDKPSNA